MIGITDIENLYNSYMAALFQDGEIKDSGIYLSESKIILCSIQLHINLSKEKVCKTSDKPTNSPINNLYFRRPIINANQTITYEALEIVIDKDVLQILNCKS